MTRRALLLAPLGLGLTQTQPTGFHVTGRLTATDQEAQEGYFALGRELALVTDPRSPLLPLLTKLLNTELTLSLQP